jgi:hypothetical protein
LKGLFQTKHFLLAKQNPSLEFVWLINRVLDSGGFQNYLKSSKNI